MDVSTTFTSTFQHTITDDISWSNLQCNWDIFSFEAELISRSQFAAENLENLKASLEENAISDCEAVNDIINVKNGFTSAKTNNQKCLSDASDIKDVGAELRKNVAVLKSKSQCLQKNIQNSEIEHSLMLKQYKCQKVSYQKALQNYSTQFDMNIDVLDRSDSSIEALIKFANSSPSIKVIVDKSKRKIIGLDSAGILTEEEERSMINKESVLEIICNIRKTIYSEKINNSEENM